MEEGVVITVPGGPGLDGRLALLREARGGVVLCHPHPLHGGDMDNPVVIRASEVARQAGLSTLRFNFRGVGRSGGTHDDGRGEREDVGAAVALLAARLEDDSPVGVVGYSFGAWVAARTAQSGTIAFLVLIAPPLHLYAFDFLKDRALPVLLAAGTRDPYCPAPDLGRLAGLVPGAEERLIEGADHFFFGKLYPLGEAIRAWLERQVRGAP